MIIRPIIRHLLFKQQFTRRKTLTRKVYSIKTYSIYDLLKHKWKQLDLKDKRKYSTDAGPYKVCDKIALDFNYTFNNSQDAADALLLLGIGNKEQDDDLIVYTVWKMPSLNEINKEI